MSFTKSVYHIVFVTHNRRQSINQENERLLYKIIYDKINQLGGHVYRIGGMPDHVHILADISSKNSLTNFAKTIKQETSYILARMNAFPDWDGWAEGYAGFSYSVSEIQNVVNYISNQKEHHRKISFREEYRAWLIEQGVSPDEPYFPK